MNMKEYLESILLMEEYDINLINDFIIFFIKEFELEKYINNINIYDDVNTINGNYSIINKNINLYLKSINYDFSKLNYNISSSLKYGLPLEKNIYEQIINNKKNSLK